MIPFRASGESNRFRNLQIGSATPPASATQTATRFSSGSGVNTNTLQGILAASGPSVTLPRRQSTTTAVNRNNVVEPVNVTNPVNVTDPGDGQGVAEEVQGTPYNVYDDPFYQQSLAGAQSQFNLARIDALANQQYQERPIQRELEDRPGIAEQQRRRLAGNFAARGMGGGRAGALTRAEAETNAREITARTGLREQISELGRQFTSQFGAEGTDWLGTRAGMAAQQAAIQQAMQNRLGGLTTV